MRARQPALWFETRVLRNYGSMLVNSDCPVCAYGRWLIVLVMTIENIPVVLVEYSVI